MDRVGTSAGPRFFRAVAVPPPSEADARVNRAREVSQMEAENIASAENPISVLNLAVQKYCVETPSQALQYVYSSVPSGKFLANSIFCVVRL